MKVRCPYCKSENVVRYGKRKCRKGPVQRYLCKECNRCFSENTEFSRMKQRGEIIAIALDLYCKNVSLRKICEHLQMIYGIKVSHVTVLKWIRKYSSLFKKFFQRVKVENGKKIHVDEMMVNINGKWYWCGKYLMEKQE